MAYFTAASDVSLKSCGTRMRLKAIMSIPPVPCSASVVPRERGGGCEQSPVKNRWASEIAAVRRAIRAGISAFDRENSRASEFDGALNFVFVACWEPADGRVHKTRPRNCIE